MPPQQHDFSPTTITLTNLDLLLNMLVWRDDKPYKVISRKGEQVTCQELSQAEMVELHRKVKAFLERTFDDTQTS